MSVIGCPVVVPMGVKLTFLNVCVYYIWGVGEW